MTRKSEKRRKGSGIQTLLTRQEKLKYRLILEGIAVGLLAGLVSSAFRWTLMEAESIRTLFVESARQKLTLAVLGIFLLGALAVFIAALLKREPLISGSGIPQVEGELHGKINANWRYCSPNFWELSAPSAAVCHWDGRARAFSLALWSAKAFRV